MKNSQKRLPLNIQYFADENGELEVPSTEKEEQVETPIEKAEEEKKEKTYTRAEVEKIKALERANWEKEQADKIAESQKLAQMDEIQKKDYEIDRLTKELAKRDADKQADDLRNEAIKQASSKGIPLEVMMALDYKNETADSIANKIEVYTKAFQTVRTSAIDDYSKEKAPQTGDRTPEEKTLSDCKSYQDFDEYYKTHPKE